MTQPISGVPATVGRIVHVHMDAFGTVPGIVTAVLDDAIKVHAFVPDCPTPLVATVVHDDSGKPADRTWRWPPIHR